jgi:hypothetical protein
LLAGCKAPAQPGRPSPFKMHSILHSCLTPRTLHPTCPSIADRLSASCLDGAGRPAIAALLPLLLALLLPLLLALLPLLLLEALVARVPALPALLDAS